MKILRIGDPHVTVSNLTESKKMMDFALEVAKKQSVDRIEILGDLFNNHAVIRSEVLSFWKSFFDKIGEMKIQTIVLVGNHDIQGDKNNIKTHALVPFDKYPYIHIVSDILVLEPFVYVGYKFTEEDFWKTLNPNLTPECHTLVCHQTFQGASYENQFYAKDGFMLDLTPTRWVISGHIHTSQSCGKCFYVGTPKWDHANDANLDKGVWVYSYNKDDMSKEFISMKDVLTPLYKYIIVEGEEIPVMPDNGKISVELRGQTAWISKMKKKFKDRAIIKAVPTDRKVVNVSEIKLSSLQEYLKDFTPIEGVSVEDLSEYLEGLVTV